MNYYVTHSTTCQFLESMGAPTAHSATIIGVTNVSAIFMTLFHCCIASHTYRNREGTVKTLMVLGTLFGIAGNIVQAVGIGRKCGELALLGRFLIGFCSADIIERETLAACVPAFTVEEAFKSAVFRFGGIIAGLFVASVYSYIPVVFDKATEHSIELQGSNWLMILLWSIHFFRVLVEMPSRHNDNSNLPTKLSSPHKRNAETGGRSEGGGQDNISYCSSSSDEVDTPASVLGRQIASATNFDRLAKHIYGSVDATSDIESYTGESSVLGAVKEKQKTTSTRQWKTASRFRKLLGFHIGIPITMLIVFYTSFAMELFFSATPLITRRYFSWHGARSVSFLGGLIFLVLPIGYVCEIVARRYEERTILKVRAKMLILC